MKRKWQLLVLFFIILLTLLDRNFKQAQLLQTEIQEMKKQIEKYESSIVEKRSLLDESNEVTTILSIINYVEKYRSTSAVYKTGKRT